MTTWRVFTSSVVQGLGFQVSRNHAVPASMISIGMHIMYRVQLRYAAGLSSLLRVGWEGTAGLGFVIVPAGMHQKFGSQKSVLFLSQVEGSSW